MVIRSVIFSRLPRLRASEVLRTPGLFGALLATAIAVCGSPARADTPLGVPDPVAQTLFQEGRDLVDKGQWEAGCTKFEAAMLLYPAASTLLNIARCLEHEKRLASAWSTYKRAQVLNRETLGEERKRAIDELIATQLEALTPRIPKLKLVMAKPVVGVSIRKDGEILPAGALGTELPLDVGEHEIAADAPGYRPFRVRLDVTEGASRSVLIELVSELQAAAQGTGPNVPTWAWLTGGGSLLFLGASAGFRIDQAYIEGKQNGVCNGDVTSNCPAGYDPASDNTRKNVDFGLSLGFGVVGAALLAASIYGIVRGVRTPSAKAPVSVTPGASGLSLSFSF